MHFFISENGDIKCDLVKCLQQILQGMTHRHMMAHRMCYFLHVLLALLHTFNPTHHSTIRMPLQEVNWANVERIWEWLCAPGCPRPMLGLRSWWLSPGDWIRMSKFTKGCTGHWSKENIQVEAMCDMTPGTYMVSNAAADPIRTFHGPELQKVMLMDYFNVEGILDTSRCGGKQQYLVKWAG